MRTTMLTLAALGLAIPVSVTIDTGTAQARKHYYSSRYSHRARRCSYSKGTQGLVAGGVAGAVLGGPVLGGGLLGTVAGAGAGALGGRAIDRSITAKRRCRY